MDYKVDTFMHAPNYSYNKVMCILELTVVIEPAAQEWLEENAWRKGNSIHEGDQSEPALFGL